MVTKKLKKIGDCKSACDYSCFNGKQEGCMRKFE